MSKGSTCKLKRVIGTPEVCVVVNHATALATVSSTLAYDLIDDILLDKCGKNTMEKIRLCEVDCCIICLCNRVLLCLFVSLSLSLCATTYEQSYAGTEQQSNASRSSALTTLLPTSGIRAKVQPSSPPAQHSVLHFISACTVFASFEEREKKNKNEVCTSSR